MSKKVKVTAGVLAADCLRAARGQRWGIESSFVPMTDWERSKKQTTKMVIFESITNPFCEPQDIGLATSFAKKHNLISVAIILSPAPRYAAPSAMEPIWSWKALRSI